MAGEKPLAAVAVTVCRPVVLNPMVPEVVPFTNEPELGRAAEPSELLYVMLLPLMGTMFQFASQALTVTTAVPAEGPLKLTSVGVPTTPLGVFGALV